MTSLDAVLFGGAAILDTISSLFLFVPGISVAVRRLHDVGQSGWWLLIAFTVIGIIFPLLYWHINPGVKGPNKYGPDPLQPFDDPSFAGIGDGMGGARSSTSGSRVCAVCSSALEPEANVCRACGSKTSDFEETAKFCSNCGLQMELDAKFCFSCGTGV